MKYTKENGIYIVEIPAEDLSIRMVDTAKKTATEGNYCNAGFFGNFKEGTDQFTLPAGHLVCDYAAKSEWAAFYCKQRGKFEGNRFIQSDGKILTTLIVAGGRADLMDVDSVTSHCDYAIAGIPVIRDGTKVLWETAKKQGWEASSLYATWHIFVALKADHRKVYCVGLKSTSGNLVDSGEGYSKLEALGFVDAIKLDGGGSFYLAAGGKLLQSTFENRRVNTILCFGGNPWLVPTRTLTEGKCGSDVKWLQRELNDQGFICGSVDGSFGNNTKTALMAYQKSAGLTVDGSCGPQTRAKLNH